jgi:hypothetical protein
LRGTRLRLSHRITRSAAAISAASQPDLTPHREDEDACDDADQNSKWLR